MAASCSPPPSLSTSPMPTPSRPSAPPTRRTGCAPTPTPPAATSTSSCPWCEPAAAGALALSAPGAPAILFDVDGTLLDSVYQHVLAWHEALQQENIELSVWR